VLGHTLEARRQGDRAHVALVGGDHDPAPHPVQEASDAHRDGVGPRPFPGALERLCIEVGPIRRIARGIRVRAVLRDKLGAGSGGRATDGVLDRHSETGDEDTGADDVAAVDQITGAEEAEGGTREESAESTWHRW